MHPFYSGWSPICIPPCTSLLQCPDYFYHQVLVKGGCDEASLIVVSGSIDPNHDTSMSTNGSNSSSYKKVEVRDANGNLKEKTVESKTGN